MFMILVNWLYMAFSTFLVGYALLGLFAHLFGYQVKRRISYIFAGLLAVTVYAQFYSLFGGVGLTANIILFPFYFLVLFCNRKKLGQLLYSWWEENFKNKRKGFVRIFFYLLLIIVFAYGTSRGYMHFDTLLYHAQSIRWIEEYGVVPGLANLQSRFAYNSAAFSLTAFYSMKELFSQSLHATAGFFALISAFLAVDVIKIFTKREYQLSFFIRLGLIFYLSVIFGEIVSPASDYYAQLLIFDILILWLEQDEIQKLNEEEKNCSPYCLLCILLVYAVTLKFSVGLLLVLVCKPAIWLIRKKDVKQILVCLGCGFITVLPFLIRNVIISGWLIYPSTAVDLFQVDWKVPKGQARLDALEIGAYGKGLNDVAKWDTPFGEWFPIWFQNLKLLEKLFVSGTFLSFCILVFMFIFYRIKKEKEERDYFLVSFVFALAAAFWFLSAPLVRYGYAYIITMPLLVFGFLFQKMLNKGLFRDKTNIMIRGFQMAVFLFLLSRLVGLYEDISKTITQPYYYAQRDYDRCEATTKELGGILFYVPVYQGQIGYELFPSSLFTTPVELRGTGLEEGFRQLGN